MPPFVVLYFLDPLERSAKTFLQQFTAILLATAGAGNVGLLVTQNWVLAADSAAFAAVASILTSVLTFKVPKLPPAVDLLLRVLKTYVQSFAGTLAASHVLSISGVDWRGALAVGVPAALFALVTGIAAMGLSNTEGASLLPKGIGTAVAADEGDEPYTGDDAFDADLAEIPDEHVSEHSAE